MLYLQIILSVIGDLILFDTSLTWNQILGGLVIVVSNFSVALLKCKKIVN